MRALVSALRVVLPTLLELAGAGAIGLGIYQIHVPSAAIWAGVACFGLSFALEGRLRAKRRRPARAER